MEYSSTALTEKLLMTLLLNFAPSHHHCIKKWPSMACLEQYEFSPNPHSPFNDSSF
jgi:hypothetical protein